MVSQSFGGTASLQNCKLRRLSLADNAEPRPTRLIGYWPFDGSILNKITTIPTSITYGIDSSNFSIGQINGSLSLNGIDEYFTTNYEFYDGDPELTISCFIKVNATDSRRCLASCGDKWTIYILDDGRIAVEGQSTVISDFSIKSLKYFHLTVSFSSLNKVSIYYDGILITQDDFYYGTNTGLLSIGRKDNSFFFGNIDDLKIWDVALSDTEIAYLALAGLGDNIRGTGAGFDVNQNVFFSPLDSINKNIPTYVGNLDGFWIFSENLLLVSASSAGSSSLTYSNCSARITSFAGGVYFDGTGQFICNDSLLTDIQETSTITISFWALLKENANQNILYKGSVSNPNWLIYLNYNKCPAIKIGSNVIESTTPFNFASVNEISFVYNNKSVKLYVNGVLGASGTVDTPPATALSFSSSLGLVGCLSSLRIWDFSFTASNILDEYKNGLLSDPSTSGLRFSNLHSLTVENPQQNNLKLLAPMQEDLTSWSSNINMTAEGFQIDVNDSMLGTGVDGALDVTSTLKICTTSTNLISTATQGDLVLNVNDSTGFKGDDEILLYTSTSTNGSVSGIWEIIKISSVEKGKLLLKTPVVNTRYILLLDENGNYIGAGVNGSHQVIRIPQYTSININSGGILTAPEWNGEKGGILVVKCKESFYIENGGYVSMDSRGFRGGVLYSNSPMAGESINGQTIVYSDGTVNFGGGGSGYGSGYSSGSGGYGTGGGNGMDPVGGVRPNTGGDIYGRRDLRDMATLGSGGGAILRSNSPVIEGFKAGGNGGGFIFIYCGQLVGDGVITANGANRQVLAGDMSAGAGSGGSVLILAKNSTYTGDVTAIGGTAHVTGGAGGDGRIAVAISNSGVQFEPNAYSLSSDTPTYGDGPSDGKSVFVPANACVLTDSIVGGQLSITDTFTIDAWVNAREVGNTGLDRTVVAKWDNLNRRQTFWLGIDKNNKYVFRVGHNAGTYGYYPYYEYYPYYSYYDYSYPLYEYVYETQLFYAGQTYSYDYTYDYDKYYCFYDLPAEMYNYYGYNEYYIYGEYSSYNNIRKYGTVITQCTSRETADTDEWVRLTAVFDGSYAYLYVDGRLVSKVKAKQLSPIYSDASLTIGSRKEGYEVADNLVGSVGTVRLWDKALTISEVKEMVDSEIYDPTQATDGYSLTPSIPVGNASKPVGTWGKLFINRDLQYPSNTYFASESSSVIATEDYTKWDYLNYLSITDLSWTPIPRYCEPTGKIIINNKNALQMKVKSSLSGWGTLSLDNSIDLRNYTYLGFRIQSTKIGRVLKVVLSDVWDVDSSLKYEMYITQSSEYEEVFWYLKDIAPYLIQDIKYISFFPQNNSRDWEFTISEIFAMNARQSGDNIGADINNFLMLKTINSH
ncbi:MAG: LamG domain-containing protein [Nanoarchaeota archaeon]